jgi:hypothetical protein
VVRGSARRATGKGGVWHLTPAQNRRRAADEVGDHGRRGGPACGH